MDQLTRHLDISYQHPDFARRNQDGCAALQHPEVSLARLRFFRDQHDCEIEKTMYQ